MNEYLDIYFILLSNNLCKGLQKSLYLRKFNS